MGCDIHTVIEEKVGDRWVGVAASDCMKRRPYYAERDYSFFGQIANVREHGLHYPKNLPRDVSELAWHLYMRCPTDHHSASHMPLEQFCLIHNEQNPKLSRLEYAVEDLTGLYDENGEEYRVVFWFDN